MVYMGLCLLDLLIYILIDFIYVFVVGRLVESDTDTLPGDVCINELDWIVRGYCRKSTFHHGIKRLYQGQLHSPETIHVIAVLQSWYYTLADKIVSFEITRSFRSLNISRITPKPRKRLTPGKKIHASYSASTNLVCLEVKATEFILDLETLYQTET